jgi:ribosome-associated protein
VTDDALLRIDDTLAVPRAELDYRATRAGGPGGQHVNTSSTRVELTWDVAASPSITDEQRARILEKLANRIDQDGVLHLTDAGSRSQHQNRETVTARFQTLIAGALRVPKRRKRTKPTRASKEARLRAKKQRGEKKRLRGPVEPHD